MARGYNKKSQRRDKSFTQSIAHIHHSQGTLLCYESQGERPLPQGIIQGPRKTEKVLHAKTTP